MTDDLGPGLNKALEIVGNLRQSEAGMFDEKHAGQRGCDRSDALWDACQAIRKAIPAGAEEKLPERAGRTHLGNLAAPEWRDALFGEAADSVPAVGSFTGCEEGAPADAPTGGILTFEEALLLDKLRLEGPQKDHDTAACRVLINRGLAKRADPGMMEFVPLCDCQHPTPTAGGFAAVSVHCPIHGDGLCDDCPPVGYETDETRCASCPRRGLEADADLRDRLMAVLPTRLHPFVAAQTAIGAELDKIAGLHGVKRKGT